MLRIGVTGGTGFIGRSFIKEYENEYEIIVATSRTDCVSMLNNVKYITVDYTKESFVHAFDGCDAVVHLGGKVMKGIESILDPSPYLGNLCLANDVFSACESLGIKNIVNASSMSVYDLATGGIKKEESELFPQSYYGIVKIAIERASELFNRKYNMKIKNLRFSQGVGIRSSEKESRFWNIVFDNCIRRIPVPVWGKGETGRDIIYVKDMAYAINCAIKEENKSGVYNIGSGTVSTNKEIAEAYCRVFDNQSGIKFIKDKEEPGIKTCLDCQKAKEELGFSPRYNLFSMIEDIKKEYESTITLGGEE